MEIRSLSKTHFSVAGCLAVRQLLVAIPLLVAYIFTRWSSVGGTVPDCSLTAIKFARFAHFAYDFFFVFWGPGGQRGAQAHAGYRPVYGAIEERASCL